MNKLLLLLIAFLVLVVNWLTFHDIFEQHTLRDWLILGVSILAFFYFVKEFFKKGGEKNG